MQQPNLNGAPAPVACQTATFLSNRWLQLAAGIIGMIAVTNFQYGWTFFVDPIARKFPSWKKEEIQVGFTIFVLTETWLVPLEAYLADVFGPRKLVFIGGLVAGLGWIVLGQADTLFLVYLGNALAGMGAGIVYGISIGIALRWFPDRRGLAAGLTSAAFGAGSALTVVPIRATIAGAGYEAAFFWFGIAQGGIVLVVALVLRSPNVGALAAAGRNIVQSSRDFTPLQMLRTPAFWLLYAMMTLVTVGGLMAIAQLAPMANSLKIHAPETIAATTIGAAALPSGLAPLASSAVAVAADARVADYRFFLFGLTITALSLAAQIDRVLNGLTRPFFGWISDHIGREKTMFLAFLFEAVAITLLIQFAHVPILFVIFSGLTFFGWGEIYSLFPALCGDMFGRRFATTNYALLYTAKGTASLLVPLGSYLHRVTGSWMPIFSLAIAFDLIVAFTALLVLRPLRRRWREGTPGS